MLTAFGWLVGWFRDEQKIPNRAKAIVAEQQTNHYKYELHSVAHTHTHSMKHIAFDTVLIRFGLTDNSLVEIASLTIPYVQ